MLCAMDTTLSVEVWFCLWICINPSYLSALTSLINSFCDETSFYWDTLVFGLGTIGFVWVWFVV